MYKDDLVLRLQLWERQFCSHTEGNGKKVNNRKTLFLLYKVEVLGLSYEAEIDSDSHNNIDENNNKMNHKLFPEQSLTWQCE